ncbi:MULTISPECIES: hypothetical protein [Paenalcaligenes]|uniref:Uncharacterized protein n=1 Tax=Paenalcaligenes hermetiae TaxID=1157987 RepID=A0ABP9MC21_9BURK|nr:hypothetical protein [Paenalcaligenes sp.]
MSQTNQLISTLNEGAVLQVYVDGCLVHAYVVVSEPNIDRVADIVPQERFDADGDIHVMAVGQPQDASAMIDDVSQNLNAEDTVVFLCIDHATKDEVLKQFGINAGQAHHH